MGVEERLKGENGKMKSDFEQTEIEAPYKLPEGWKWCRLGEVCKFENGYAFKSDKFAKEGIPVVRITNLKDNEVSLEDCVYTTEDNIEERFIVKKGDLLIAMSGATTGKNGVYLFDKIVYLNQRVGNIKVIDSTILNDKYRNFYIQAKEQDILKNAYGGAQPNISSTKICAMPFPLPPTLAEQQRIVNRIESMFAKLDEAKEKAQNVVDGFETRKAAILHKAFTGELTAKWRKENGVSDDSWEEKTVGDCCVEVKVGIVIKPTRYYTEAEKGIPAFRSANVRENHIDDFDWVYINDEGMKNEQRSIVHTNDVLVVRSGAPGTACVVTDQFDGYNAIDILIAVPTQDIINSYFLCYYTNSPMGKNIVAEKKRGLGLTHFNVKGYSATPIKVPTLPEQQEIVRILETVLEKESRAKEASQTVLDQIALLKKSILARAFRGEL